MNFDIGKRHVAAAIFLGVLLGIWQYQCDVDEQRARERAEAEDADEGTPSSRLAHFAATEAVFESQQAGLEGALRGARRAVHGAERTRREQAPDREERELLSVVFSSNIRGELEDCGCKARPLGGVARRATMVDLARDGGAKEARKWWGEESRRADTLVDIDAGDLLYRSPTVRKRPERLQEKARREAAALVDALAVDAPDVLNVGRLDLVFGLQDYRDLVEKADLPVVSANLIDDGGERPFPGHRVIARDGRQIAVVGVLGEGAKELVPEGEGAIEVEDPAKAYRDEVAEIGDDVDLVVLASNLGLSDTKRLVEELRDEEVRLDLAVVSNSGQLTQNPEWISGAPLLEPQTRGKYLGRLDVYLDGDDEIAFANAAVDASELLSSYQRAWSGYVEARRRDGETGREIARLQLELEGRDGAESGQTAREEKRPKEEGKELGAERRREIESEIEKLRERKETLEKRVETASADLASQTKRLPAIADIAEVDAEGGDWLEANIAPLDLDIPQQKEVRGIVERATESGD